MAIHDGVVWVDSPAVAEDGGSWQLMPRTADRGETLFGVFSSSATSSPFSHEPGAN